MRFIGGAIAAAPLIVCAACVADRRDAPTSPIDLSIVAPKGLLDEADAVKLEVYQKASCKGPDLATTADSSKLGDAHPLSKGAGGAWSVTFQVPQNPDDSLTWYVEGSKTGTKTFRGCTVMAVNQQSLTIPIKVVRIVPGAVCGDAIVGATETCDPGTGNGNEACDDTTCQTKEVVVSNGNAANQFFKGLPARKTGVSTRILDDGKFFAAWSDAATGGSGGDGNGQITWRRLTADLTTDKTVTLLQTEGRLQTEAFSAGGSNKRGGASLDPSIVPVEGGNLFVVFARTPPGDRSHVYGSLSRTNLGAAAAADQVLSGVVAEQTSPAAAGNGSGDVLSVWIEASAVKSVLRKAGGALSSVQSISSGGANATPRIAWVGGDYVVVWNDGNDVKLRRVDASGTPKGSAQIATGARASGKHDQPVVAGFADGSFVVAWRDAGGDGDNGADIRAQRFDKTGAPVGAEIAAALNDVNGAGDQSSPSVAAGTSGGARFYLVAWVDEGRTQIGARFLDADAGGFLYNNVNGTKSEFDVATSARPVSSPSAFCGGAAPGVCAITFVDDSDGDAAADDDRVRVRRFPVPSGG